MSDLLYKQNTSASIAKAPTVQGEAVTEKYFDVSDVINDSTSYNESTTSRFLLAASASDQVVGMGTVQAGKLLIIKPSADIGMKLTNGLGESQLITFKANKMSIIHADFTEIKLTNPSATADVKGQLLVAGD